MKGYVSWSQERFRFQAETAALYPLDCSFFIVRPRTGGRMNSVMDATSSSTTWKVTHATFSLSPQHHVMEGDLPSQSPSLLVLLEGSNGAPL